MPTVVEQQSAPQHLQALAHANRTRLGHASVKKRINEGTMTVADALIAREARTMTLFDLLIAQRRWGRQRTVKLLMGLCLPERKAVMTLTPRQRRVLVEALAESVE